MPARECSVRPGGFHPGFAARAAGDRTDSLRQADLSRTRMPGFRLVGAPRVYTEPGEVRRGAGGNRDVGEAGGPRDQTPAASRLRRGSRHGAGSGRRRWATGRARTLPEGTDLLPQIRHIVILMMENHSYDNYLGMLTDRGEGLPLGPGRHPRRVKLLPNGEAFPAHHMTSTTQMKNIPARTGTPPISSTRTGARRVRQPPWPALPGADPAGADGLLDRDDLPFYYGLARTFPLADRWFSSCLGQDVPQPQVPHLRDGPRTHRRPADGTSSTTRRPGRSSTCSPSTASPG